MTGGIVTEGGPTMWTGLEVGRTVATLVADLAPGGPETVLDAGGQLIADARLVDDCGFHSLALMELAMSLEDEFGLPTLDESIARSIQTVGDVRAHVLTELSRTDQLSDRIRSAVD
jgi:acyl carrier protein